MTLPPDDSDIIKAFRRKHGLGNTFDAVVKKTFLDAIGEDAFHHDATRYIREDATWTEVGTRLGVHSGTISKWENWEKGLPNGNRPGWKHLFNYLVLIDADLPEVFPEPRVTLVAGITGALDLVVGELRTRGACPAELCPPPLSPDDARWPCLVTALLTIRYADLRNEQTRDDALQEALRKVKELLPRMARELDLALLRSWVGAWFIPWCLFWDALDGVLEE
jgi:hypothetical protein